MEAHQGMDTEQEGRVQTVAEVAGLSPAEARWFLEACDWSVESAAARALDHVAGTRGSAASGANYMAPASRVEAAAPSLASPLPPRPHAPVAPGMVPPSPTAVPPGPPRRTLIGSVLRAPWRVVSGSLSILSFSISMTLGVAVFFGDRLFPAAVMRGLRGLIGQNEEPDPAQQAAAFVQLFRAAYGVQHPAFVESSMRTTGQASRLEHKFMLVYLHAPHHQDTDQFCREVLSAPDLLDYMGQQYVVWGGDVTQTDAYQVSLRLGATTYPFVAVLHMGADNNRVSLVTSSQGQQLLARGHLLGLLQRTMDQQGALLVAQRVEVQERDFTRQLLAQQNDEYEVSLAADRAREAERGQLQQREAAAAAAALAEEARKREVSEAEERQRCEAAEQLVARRKAKRALLTPEPAPGSSGAAVVRVRLPDGSFAQRSYADGTCVSELFDFVDSLDSPGVSWSYSLVSTYPRKVFSRAEGLQASLAEAGLVPTGALFVQPDSEAEI